VPRDVGIARTMGCGGALVGLRFVRWEVASPLS